MDAMRGARKQKYDCPLILSRWQNDEQFRTSQLKNWWTETYCKYLDYLPTIDISHNAPYHQRSRYENTITLKSNDPNPQSGPMWKREDYQATTQALLSLREEQRRTNTFYPEKYEDQAENTLDPELQRGKTFNGKTLVGKITNGTIIHGKIINGDQGARMRCFFSSFAHGE